MDAKVEVRAGGRADGQTGRRTLSVLGDSGFDYMPWKKISKTVPHKNIEL
jgi:hypothetical protein